MKHYILGKKAFNENLNTIKEVTLNKEFKKQSLKRIKSKDFIEDIKTSMVLSNISYDFSNDLDSSLLLTTTGAKELANSYYKNFDKLTNENFLNKSKELDKYLHFVDDDGENYYSCCRTQRVNEKIFDKQIYIIKEDALVPVLELVHEEGHAFSEPFNSGKNFRDKNIEELPSTINVSMFLNFLKSIDRYKLEALIQEKIFYKDSLSYAKMSYLKDLLALKSANLLRDDTFLEIVSSLPASSLNSIDLLNCTASTIKNGSFNLFFVKSPNYHLPIMISKKLDEVIKDNYIEGVKLAKTFIKDSYKMEKNDILKEFGLSSTLALANDYADKLPSHLKNLEEQEKRL